MTILNSLWPDHPTGVIFWSKPMLMKQPRFTGAGDGPTLPAFCPGDLGSFILAVLAAGGGARDGAVATSFSSQRKWMGAAEA